MPYQNAKNIPLGQTSAGLPNVNAAITGWFQPMTFERVCKTQVDGYTQEINTVIHTRGCRQPLSPYDLSIKQEGERSWNWEMMHCLPEVVLKTDDIIKFQGVPYRVMKIFNWAQYGYMQYEIAQDFRSC